MRSAGTGPWRRWWRTTRAAAATCAQATCSAPARSPARCARQDAPLASLCFGRVLIPPELHRRGCIEWSGQRCNLRPDECFALAYAQALCACQLTKERHVSCMHLLLKSCPPIWQTETLKVRISLCAMKREQQGEVSVQSCSSLLLVQRSVFFPVYVWSSCTVSDVCRRQASRHACWRPCAMARARWRPHVPGLMRTFPRAPQRI